MPRQYKQIHFVLGQIVYYIYSIYIIYIYIVYIHRLIESVRPKDCNKKLMGDLTKGICHFRKSLSLRFNYVLLHYLPHFSCQGKDNTISSNITWNCSLHL